MELPPAPGTPPTNMLLTPNAAAAATSAVGVASSSSSKTPPAPPLSQIARAKSFVIKKDNFKQAVFAMTRSSSFNTRAAQGQGQVQSHNGTPARKFTEVNGAIPEEELERMLGDLKASRLQAGSGGGVTLGRSRLKLRGENEEEKAEKQGRFKMKESTRLFIKIHIINEKALEVDKLLRTLQELTMVCQEGDAEDPEAESEFKNCVQEIGARVKFMQKMVLSLCRHRFMERHFGALSSIQDKMRPTVDISVQFFGLDWPHVFRISSNLVEQVSDIRETLKENGGDCSKEISVILPSNVLRNLTTIQSDIDLHADAVLRGRLSAKNQEDITLAQTRHIRWLQGRQKARGQGKGQEVDLESEVYPELEKVARRRSLWGALKDIQLAMFRKTKNNNNRHHDDLWRTWYMGVQTMGALNHQTINSTPDHQVTNGEHPAHGDIEIHPQPLVLNNREMDEEHEVTHALINSGAGVDERDVCCPPNCEVTINGESNPMPVMKVLVNGKSFDMDHEYPPSPTCLTPPPSNSEVKEVLGVYSDHLSNARTPCLEDQRKEIIDYCESKMVHDDTLESIHLVDKFLAEAPRQKVDESEL